MNRNSYFKDYTKYTVLNVLGMVGLSCYILADTFFISKGLGANGLTALNLAIPIYSFIHGCGLMLGMGGATRYSIYKIRKNTGDADLIFTNTVILALVFSAVFVLTGVFLSKPLTAAVGADSEVFSMTNTYLKVILLFSPAFILNNVFICFVRNDGNPNLSMTAMLTGSISNILFDYIFIFPLKMGIFGAVLATGFAPVISMLILFRHRVKKKNGFHFVRNSPNPGIAAKILSLGFPSLVTELSSGIVIIVFNAVILRLLGNVGVAAYGVIANISLVVISIYTGISEGIQPLLSRAYGHNDGENMKWVLRYAMITMFILSGIIYLGMFFLAEPVVGIFNSENNLQLQEIAVQGMRLYFTGIAFAGFNMILSVFFTSTEKAVPAQVISILRGLVVIVPMTYLLAMIRGIQGVWLAFPAAELMVAIFSAAIYLRFRKKIYRGQ